MAHQTGESQWPALERGFGPRGPLLPCHVYVVPGEDKKACLWTTITRDIDKSERFRGCVTALGAMMGTDENNLVFCVIQMRETLGS